VTFVTNVNFPGHFFCNLFVAGKPLLNNTNELRLTTPSGTNTSVRFNYQTSVNYQPADHEVFENRTKVQTVDVPGLLAHFRPFFPVTNNLATAVGVTKASVSISTHSGLTTRKSGDITSLHVNENPNVTENSRIPGYVLGLQREERVDNLVTGMQTSQNSVDKTHSPSIHHETSLEYTSYPSIQNTNQDHYPQFIPGLFEHLNHAIPINVTSAKNNYHMTGDHSDQSHHSTSLFKEAVFDTGPYNDLYSLSNGHGSAGEVVRNSWNIQPNDQFTPLPGFSNHERVDVFRPFEKQVPDNHSELSTDEKMHEDATQAIGSKPPGNLISLVRTLSPDGPSEGRVYTINDYIQHKREEPTDRHIAIYRSGHTPSLDSTQQFEHDPIGHRLNGERKVTGIGSLDHQFEQVLDVNTPGKF